MKFSSDAIMNAYKVLDGEKLSHEEALQLIRTEDPYRMDLYALADKVRMKYCRNPFEACEISNAKSGGCSEDCSFCAQSAHNKAKSPFYKLRRREELLKDAAVAKEHGADAFCIVVSGQGYEEADKEFEEILGTVRAIRKEIGMEVHSSLGILSRETALMLKDAGVSVIHHNIETAPSYFPSICTTHPIEKRIETVRAVKSAGIRVCCGGIIGLGETDEQRVEFAEVLSELDVDVIPVNVLQKIEGTRIAPNPLTVHDVLNSVAVFRLLNPGTTIKAAAGRESTMGDYQGLLFHAGANGMLIGGYLTIKGRSVEQDKNLIKTIA